MSLAAMMGQNTVYVGPVPVADDTVELDLPDLIPSSSLYADAPLEAPVVVHVVHGAEEELSCCDELSARVHKHRNLIGLLPFAGTGIGIHRIYKELKSEVPDKWEIAKGFTELFSFAILPSLVLAMVYAVKAIIACCAKPEGESEPIVVEVHGEVPDIDTLFSALHDQEEEEPAPAPTGASVVRLDEPVIAPVVVESASEADSDADPIHDLFDEDPVPGEEPVPMDLTHSRTDPLHVL